ncbi:MAG: MFS transporter, partial [Solirubrobacteraceae bacterium]|nr:MFS transporter [Solirubrobacteraceae bacterium]
GGYLGLAAAPTIAVACAVAIVGGFGNGFNWIALVTAVQEATPDDRQGRAAINLEAIATVGPAVGFLIGGALADAASPRLTLLIPGLLALAILAFATALAVVRLRTQAGSVLAGS